MISINLSLIISQKKKIMSYTIPRSKEECPNHLMWRVSKRCVLCDEQLIQGQGRIDCNLPLFHHHYVQFIRACDKHRQEVIENFSKPEFQPPFAPATTAFCQGCRQPFSISDDPSSFCSKFCRGNWLDRIH